MSEPSSAVSFTFSTVNCPIYLSEATCGCPQDSSTVPSPTSGILSLTPNSNSITSLYSSGQIKTQKVTWQLFPSSTISFGSDSAKNTDKYEGTLTNHPSFKGANQWKLRYIGMYYGNKLFDIPTTLEVVIDTLNSMVATVNRDSFKSLKKIVIDSYEEGYWNCENNIC